MKRTESKSWSGKNDIVPRTPKFSNHVVKGGIKTTGKGSPAAREPIDVNKTRNTSEITEDNTVKTTGNGSTNIGDFIAKNKEQIKQRLRDQKQRKKGQNIVRFGAWDQESEKLETDLVPSDTLRGAPTVKT